MSNTHTPPPSTPPPAAPAPAHSPLPWRVVEEPDGLWIIDAADRMVCRLFGSITASMAARAAATAAVIVSAVNTHAEQAAEVERLRAEVERLSEQLEHGAQEYAQVAADFDRLREQRDGLLSALAPFARFWQQWSRQPLRGIDDEFYVIHSGTEFAASLRLSDCRAASEAIAAVNAPATPPVAGPVHGQERTVTVCSACKRASCWQGAFYCEAYQTSAVVEMPVSALAALDLESPHYWSADIHGADVRAEVAPSGKAVLP